MARKRVKKPSRFSFPKVNPEDEFRIVPPTEEEQQQIIKKLDPCDIASDYEGGIPQYLIDQFKAGNIKLVHHDDYPIPSLKNIGITNPELRPACIEGIMRRGETMNVIASPKMGKSWLTGNLVMAFASGSKWFEKFQVERGKTLIFDNELHAETLYYRYKLLGDSLGIPQNIWETMIHVVPLRGKNVDIYALDKWLSTIKPGEYTMCLLDSFYRFMPKGLNENDNASMTQLYNTIDQYAENYDLSFALIHHASKGVQSNKAVTDVGSGAGAQSRAADVHLILRDHEEQGVIVVDLAVRSFEPVAPFCVRFNFPKFELAKSYDPDALKGKDSGRGRPSRDREEANKVMSERLLGAISKPMTTTQMERLAESIGFKISSASLKRLVVDWQTKNKLLMVEEGTGNKPTTYINPEAKDKVEPGVETVPENKDTNVHTSDEIVEYEQPPEIENSEDMPF